jgi:ribosomal protein L37E
MVMTCERCGTDTFVIYVTLEGKLCADCEDKRREKEQEEYAINKEVGTYGKKRLDLH